MARTKQPPRYVSPQLTWDMDAFIALSQRSIPDTGQKYYVYCLAVKDRGVFYIGKGTGDRINMHEVEARAGVKSYKCNIIRQIWAIGDALEKTIVYRTDDEDDAYAMEARFVRACGMENLSNQTKGGRGAQGFRRLWERYMYGIEDKALRDATARNLWSADILMDAETHLAETFTADRARGIREQRSHYAA